MLRGLRLRPGTGRSESEDREPFGWRVMGPTLRRDLFYPHIFDAQFLAEQEDLLPEPAEFGLQPDAGVDAVRRDAASVGQRGLGKGDRVDDGGADTTLPAGRERDLRERRFGENEPLREGFSECTMPECGQAVSFLCS